MRSLRDLRNVTAWEMHLGAPIHCFACWLTKEGPYTFASSLELELHLIARHPKPEVS